VGAWWHHADAAALPFAPRSFDAVLLRHALEYLPRPLMTAAIAEATRVARGMVVLSFYERDEVWLLYAKS